jgi:hypothetical protein
MHRDLPYGTEVNVSSAKKGRSDKYTFKIREVKSHEKIA